MDELQIRLFGDVSVRQEGRSVQPSAGKALELFCYLLLHRDRAHTRETLSEVLWPGGESAAAKRYLRQALWRLSTALPYRPDSHGKGNELLLISDHGWMRINPEVSWWLDVSEFERAYASARDTAGHSLSDRQAHDLEAALGLYRGDLLATWYHDWCSYDRDRLQLVYLAILDQLTGYCEARRLYAKGLDFGQAVLRVDPARECTHRQLMRLHYQAGGRTSAIRQYERCTAAMDQEFGVAPSADTVTLYDQICADHIPDIPMMLPTGSPMVQRPTPERPEIAALADLHVRLDQIQASLCALQESVLQSSGMRFQHAPTTQNGWPGKRVGMLGIGGTEGAP